MIFIKNMDKEEVRKIIREELSSLIGIDRYLFQKSLQIFDGKNIQLGRTNGTIIGTASDQKLGFYGNTPIVQGSAISDPTGSGDAGVDTPARNTIIAILDALRGSGLIDT